MQHTHSAPGKIVAGLLIIGVGIVFFLRQTGYIFPQWLFTWPMLLIVIGLINGAKMGFRDFGWLILVSLGLIFHFSKLYPLFHVTRYAWPLFIMGAGLFLILKRNQSCPDRAARRQRRHIRRNRFVSSTPPFTEVSSATAPEPPAFTPTPNYSVYADVTAEPPSATHSEFVDITAILGGNKRYVLSKNVRGADITAIMGGVELNFSQADIQGPTIIDLNLLMGGCKLIVPANWLIKSDITSVIGIIEDKRHIFPTPHEAHPKILILKGFAIMSGIEITSYS